MQRKKERKVTLEDLMEGHRLAQEETRELKKALKLIVEAQKKEQARRQKEQERRAKWQREREKSQREWDERYKKIQVQQDELSRKMGLFNDRWGQFMENLVEGDMLKLMQGKGIDVKEVHSHVLALKEDGHTRLAEYDLVAYNGDELVVAEVKTTLFRKDVANFVAKLKKFKAYFPYYKHHKIYGAVAYMGEAREEKGKVAGHAEESGLFVIKSPKGGPGLAVVTNAEGFEPRLF